jgi:hypothetical protein
MNTQPLRGLTIVLAVLLTAGCMRYESESGTARPEGRRARRALTLLPPAWTATPTPGPTRTPSPMPTKAPAATSTPRLPWMPCPSAPPSQLQPGQEVYVSFAPELSSRLRDLPSREQGGIVGILEAGEKATIVRGPECGGNMVWWYVRPAATRPEGWTPEGDWDAYWLLPLPSGSQ